ncbi:hypothetical protein ACFLW4_07195, partial [Chloroflexota bacterium]
VIKGKPEEKKPRLTEAIEKQLHYMYLSGATAKETIAKVARETDLSRKELYRAWLKSVKAREIEKESIKSFERS